MTPVLPSQVVSQLAPSFRVARGFDRSDRQLGSAIAGPNIEYAQADGHALPLEPASVDLLTVRR
jgi:hypothetical protein